MPNAPVVKTGLIGAAVAAICCFTPVIAVLLAALGLSAWIGRLDYVLLPALLAFIAVAGYGLFRRSERHCRKP